jgi:hypothetical protein
MKKQTDTATSIVRAFAAASGTFRKIEAQAALGLTMNQIKRAVDTLYRQGYLRRIQHGLYQACHVVETPIGDCNDKIWRAMKVSSTFSAAEIARLASSTRSYVYKRFRQFRADGLIKPAGVRPTYGSGTEKLWRLTLKGKEKAQAPTESAYKPDPVVMATVNLNRLICSGTAVRDADAAREAISLMQVIMEAMKGVLDEG